MKCTLCQLHINTKIKKGDRSLAYRTKTNRNPYHKECVSTSWSR